MKIIITEEQYKTLNEMIKLDIKVGDTLMGGKFKNKKIVVKTIGKNDKGDITINGKPLLRFRLLKEDISIPIDKRVEIFKKWLYKEYPNISHLEVTRKKDPYLNPSRFKDIPLVIVHYTESDSGGYSTWQPNYRSWLTMDIVNKWNKITNNSIPITGSFYDKIDHKRIQILVDADDFSEDEGESINENDNSKVVDKNIIDKYIKHVAPQLSPENIRFVMSPSEDGVNIYVIDEDRFNLRSKLVGFFDNDYGTDDKRLYLEPIYYKLFKVFGDNPDLILDWFNRTYESKLKQMFNEVDWEVNSISIVK